MEFLYDKEVCDISDNPDNLEESIIGFEALYYSMYKCRKGVMWKGSVASFFLNGTERVLQLEKHLKDGTYKASPPVKFKVTSPKEREILSITFKDRVYQRSLNDNNIYPVMSKGFIRDNCACQKGKGTDYARDRMKCFLQKCFRKKGRNLFVLQCDIHGYYPNMRHDVAKKIFKRKLDPYVFARAEKVLDEQYAGDVGFNPGSQMIQIAGISVLDPIDHYIKEVLHIKYYIRYMDDFILLHEDAEYLEECKVKLRIKLSDMGFTFNENKTRVFPLKNGIMFLGFRFVLTDKGKVLMLLNPDNVKRERRKLYRLVSLAKKGERTHSKVDDCYSAWRNHASKGNNYNLILRMDKYYNNLWKGE